MAPSEVRCNMYNRDGKGLIASNGELGCQNRGCRFVHPGDPEWDLAATSRIPPPRRNLHPSVWEEFGYDKPDFGYGHSPSKRRTSSVERPGRSREKDSIESPRLGHSNGAAPYRDTGRDHSPSHPSSPSTSMSRRRSRSRSRQRGGDKTPVAGPSSASALAPLGKNIPWIPSVVSKPPAPTAPTSLRPMSPPPPLPRPPSFLDENMPELANGVSLEDRRQAWTQRVQLIADALKCRSDHKEFEQQAQENEQLMRTQYYQTLGDERNYLTSQIAEARQQSKVKKQELKDAMAKLVETNFWPVIQPTNTSEAEEKYQAIRKAALELKAVITEVNSGLHTIITGQNITALKSSNENTMNDQRPLKRRRVSESGEAGIFEGGNDIPPEALSRIQDRLQDLEARVVEVENDITQRDNNFREEIMDAVEAKWMESGPPLTGQPDQDDTIKEIQGSVSHTETELEELSEEVGKLMLERPALYDEMERLKKEDADLRGMITQSDQTYKQLQEEMEKGRKHTDALNAALSAHLARPPSPTPAPTSEPANILAALEVPIQESVLNLVHPLLDNLYASITNHIDSQNQELNASLWSKLQMTLKMVNAIAKKVEQENQGGERGRLTA